MFDEVCIVTLGDIAFSAKELKTSITDLVAYDLMSVGIYFKDTLTQSAAKFHEHCELESVVANLVECVDAANVADVAANERLRAGAVAAHDAARKG